MSDAGCPECGGVFGLHEPDCEYEDAIDGNEEDYDDE